MERLASIDGLVISQKKEWGEIVTGIEQKNKYAVLDSLGNELYRAAEEGGSFFMRYFLTAWRPFTVVVRSPEGQQVIKAVRPFKFYFHQLSVYGPGGELLGTIQRRFSLIRRLYSVQDSSGVEQFELYGPLLHPWTFEIRNAGTTHGKITKKWSGLLKEGFTDADNFGVTFPAGWEARMKALLLGAVFLIDFVHFESTRN